MEATEHRRYSLVDDLGLIADSAPTNGTLRRLSLVSCGFERPPFHIHDEENDSSECAKDASPSGSSHLEAASSPDVSLDQGSPSSMDLPTFDNEKLASPLNLEVLFSSEGFEYEAAVAVSETAIADLEHIPASPQLEDQDDAALQSFPSLFLEPLTLPTSFLNDTLLAAKNLKIEVVHRVVDAACQKEDQLFPWELEMPGASLSMQPCATTYIVLWRYLKYQKDLLCMGNAADHQIALKQAFDFLEGVQASYKEQAEVLMDVKRRVKLLDAKAKGLIRLATAKKIAEPSLEEKLGGFLNCLFEKSRFIWRSASSLDGLYHVLGALYYSSNKDGDKEKQDSALNDPLVVEGFSLTHEAIQRLVSSVENACQKGIESCSCGCRIFSSNGVLSSASQLSLLPPSRFISDSTDADCVAFKALQYKFDCLVARMESSVVVQAASLNLIEVKKVLKAVKHPFKFPILPCILVAIEERLQNGQLYAGLLQPHFAAWLAAPYYLPKQYEPSPELPNASHFIENDESPFVQLNVLEKGVLLLDSWRQQFPLYIRASEQLAHYQGLYEVCMDHIRTSLNHLIQTLAGSSSFTLAQLQAAGCVLDCSAADYEQKELVLKIDLISSQKATRGAIEKTKKSVLNDTYQGDKAHVQSGILYAQPPPSLSQVELLNLGSRSFFPQSLQTVKRLGIVFSLGYTTRLEPLATSQQMALDKLLLELYTNASQTLTPISLILDKCLTLDLARTVELLVNNSI